MNVFQIVMLGIVGVIFILQLKKERGELAILLGILIGIIIFVCIFEHLKLLVRTIKEIGSYSNIEKSYITTLIKMLGITYLAEFASGICKDAGQNTIALQIEMFSKISILVLSLPILLSLLRSIQEFLP